MKRAEAKRLAKFCMLDENDENILKQIAMGTKEESEHAIADTVEKRAAIAAEHIREDPHYYTKLKGAGFMKAMFVLGKSEGKKKGKALHGKDKVAFVMKEFAAGRLKSSDGKVVTDKKQAAAIAYSEAGMKSQQPGHRAILVKALSAHDPLSEGPAIALGLHPTVEACHVFKASELKAAREST
jgi:hypothetical protein